MKISEVITIVDRLCPPDLAEEWDNCGWQVNCGDDTVCGIMTTLEITEDTIKEAEENGANLIITHHPMLFNGIKSVDVNMVSGKYIHRLIGCGISVYSCHTNFDKVSGGNNDYLAKVIDLTDVEILEDGYTRTGCLKETMTVSEFADFVKRKLGLKDCSVRVCGSPEKPVRKAGWCTGAGFDFAKNAADAGCDAFITGDVKYHEARDTAESGGMAVIDAGHYGTEVSFGKNMAEILTGRLPSGMRVFPSEKIADSFFY